MLRSKFREIWIVSFSVFFSFSFLLFGCGGQGIGTNVNLANSRTNASNSISDPANTSSVNRNSMGSAAIESREPNEYQADVTLKLEAIGGQQNIASPTLMANVARSGADRRMEFALPAGGRVIYLDKGDNHYLLLPERKQYAELNRDSLGFDVRRMLMPEQIVEQVKNVAGMQLVGDETFNGRDAVKYRYAAVANTQSRAGQVDTESFLIVDKATGLPLRSETVSRSTGDAQGYNGLHIITEIGNIKTETAPELFASPTGLQKIDSAQVRGQIDMIFNSVAMLVGQLMKQGQPAANSTVSPAK